MDSTLFTTEFAKLFPEINLALGTGLMILARLLGVMKYAPPFNRTEIPSMAKIGLAFLLSVTLTIVMKPSHIPPHTSILFCIALNYAFGFLIGYIVNVIIATITSAGDIINSQMGMSSAMVLDPSTGKQNSLIGNYFTMLAILIFMNIGGIYWIIEAFIRSFEIFPIYASSFSLKEIIHMDYLIKITANTFIVGMQISAPILLATLGQDIILGTISKTAPQVNVFQMSFLFKPVMGALIIIWVLPSLINVISDYLTSLGSIF